MPWPVHAIHTHLLPTGKVMFYGRDDDARLWDPATNTFSSIARAGFNIFCTGHSFLPDGRLLLTGGHIASNTGLPNAAIWDPFTDTWTHLPNMNAGRWYPTHTTMPNGDVLVISGAIDPQQNNPLPQVWQTNGAWRDLSTASISLHLYPFMFLTSSGRVFNAGPQTTTRWLDTSGTGAWTTVGDRASGLRDYASAVMYEEGKIMIAGGGDPPLNSVEVIDLNVPNPAWRTVAPMSSARRNLNATLLPDGKVLITGGSSGPGFDDANTPVLTTELWDPATERFTTLAPMPGFRGYHSIALLLPDGRILSAGSDASPFNAEIYSPPYLYKGARPTVTTVPSTLAYGESFAVATPDAARVTAVTFLRLGSVTHAYNMEQRFMRLPFSVTADGLTATAPANANLAPPGYYLLFLIDSNGVPSVGRIIRIGGTAPPPDPTGVTVILPADNSTMSGLNTLQAYANGRSLSTYNMFWQVDGDRLNPMADSNTGGQYKEALVDFTNWTWRGSDPYGPYLINFVAQDLSGALIGESSVTIWVTTALSAPGSLTATAQSSSQIALNWTESSTNETAFLIERCAGVQCTNFAQIAQVGANVTSYVDAGLSANASYSYRVRASNGQSFSAYSNTASATTSGALPAAPTALTATAVSPTQIDLTWSDNATNETAYTIERCTEGCTTFTQIAQVGANVTAYSNTGLTAGATYSYRVRASNAAGNSAYSNVAAATTTGPPSAPTNLTATPGPNYGEITLNWTDTSGNESGFRIERCEGSTCTSFSQIATVGPNVVTFRNSGKKGRVYRYRIRAYNAAGNSAYSAIASAIPR